MYHKDLMSLYPLDAGADYSAGAYRLSGSAEIDLRQEFLSTIFGSGLEIPKGHPLLIRRLRRDPGTFARTPCVCVSILTQEPDRDTVCNFCHGVGFYWDEELTSGYRIVIGAETGLAHRVEHLKAGLIQQEQIKYYLSASSNIEQGDMLIELVLDAEGAIAQPARRKAIFYPATIEVKRLDRGRIEFYILSCPNSNIVLIDKATYSYINNPIG